MSTNTPLLKKDSAFELEFAYMLLHKPEIDFLKEGCNEPFKNLQRIQNWYDNNNFPSKPYNSLSVKPIRNNNYDLIIYPNPGNGKINISGNIENRNINSIEIINHNGQPVLLLHAFNKSGTLNSILDTGFLSQGIYFVKITTDKEILIKKVVKL